MLVVTQKNVKTRGTVNAFNTYHQIVKKTHLNANLSVEAALGKFSDSHLREVWDLSRAEVEATVNMLKHMPSDVVETLKDLASEFGITSFRATLSHATIAAHAFRNGYLPQMEAESYALVFENKPSTLRLMVKRMKIDWLSTPESLRRTLTVDRI